MNTRGRDGSFVLAFLKFKTQRDDTTDTTTIREQRNLLPDFVTAAHVCLSFAYLVPSLSPF